MRGASHGNPDSWKETGASREFGFRDRKNLAGHLYAPRRRPSAPHVPSRGWSPRRAVRACSSPAPSHTSTPTRPKAWLPLGRNRHKRPRDEWAHGGAGPKQTADGRFFAVPAAGVSGRPAGGGKRHRFSCPRRAAGLHLFRRRRRRRRRRRQADSTASAELRMHAARQLPRQSILYSSAVPLRTAIAHLDGHCNPPPPTTAAPDSPRAPGLRSRWLPP